MDSKLIIPNGLLIIVFITAILIWLIVLTIFYVRILSHYNNLSEGVGKENLENILKQVLQKQDKEAQEIVSLSNKIKILQRQDLTHIQKIGFLKFNSFNEVGGNNSFTLCLLDANLDGVIMTGLHARDKTRIYAKKIKNGKSSSELSKEENKSMEEALK